MRVLETEKLAKNYGAIHALSELDLCVNKGEIFGILGPNGSGKTTTLGIVLGVLRASGGQFRWFEQPAFRPSVLRRVGVLLETPNFYPTMSAVQNLRIVAHLKNVRTADTDDLLRLVKLYERRHDPVSTYSLGMKQRLAIAAAMIAQPDVVIFDEPTNGLDPQGIAEVRELIVHIAQQGKTIIMASHILDEVEKICSHVAIIKKGKLLASGSVDSIIGGAQLVEAAASNMQLLHSVLLSCPFVHNLTNHLHTIHIELQPSHTTTDLNAYLIQQGVVLSHLMSRHKSLEAEFLELTKDK